MSRAAPAVLALAAILLAPAAASPATAPDAVAVTLDPPALTVGDPVAATLELVVEGDGADALFPDWAKGWGEAEVLEAGPVERTRVGDGTRLRQRLRITAFRPGAIALPPVEVRRGPSGPALATTPATLALEVRSVLPAEEPEVAPLPPEPPRPLDLPVAVFWAIGGMFAAIFAAALLARRRRLADAASPAAPPHAELLAALDALAGAEPEAGHRALSHALRRYLGRALAFPALESTTREIERALAGRHLDAALVRRAARLLREGDLVKFGRRSASGADLEAGVAEARALGEAVEAHLRPPVEPEAPAA